MQTTRFSLLTFPPIATAVIFQVAGWYAPRPASSASIDLVNLPGRLRERCVWRQLFSTDLRALFGIVLKCSCKGSEATRNILKRYIWSGFTSTLPPTPPMKWNQMYAINNMLSISMISPNSRGPNVDSEGSLRENHQQSPPAVAFGSKNGFSLEKSDSSPTNRYR